MCLCFQIPWIFCWSFNTTSYPPYKMLIKNLKIKWWEKYNFQHATIKHMKEWFAENNYLQDIDQRKNIEFLNDKSKLLALLAQATTDTNFQRLLSTECIIYRHQINIFFHIGARVWSRRPAFLDLCELRIQELVS